jgi:hypothetical protein
MVLAGFVAAGTRDHLQCSKRLPTCSPVLPKGLQAVQKVGLGHLVEGVIRRQEFL